MYEVRYVLDNGGKTPSSMLEVVPADAPLNAGKLKLQPPARYYRYRTLERYWGWSGPAYCFAEDSAADFTLISAHKVDEATSQEFTLPDSRSL